MTRIALATLTLAVLAGCSSAPRAPEYACPLDQNAINRGACASMQDAYKASRTMQRGSENGRVQSVFDARVQENSPQNERPMFSGQPSNYPDPGQTGMPVFQQPKVLRVWVAPYVDADGNLRSGEYTYISTPGSWNYGTTTKPGSASGIFEPQRPSNLGFTPNVVSNGKNAAQPARPAAPPENTGGVGSSASQSTPSTGSTPAPSAAGAARTESNGGITQPYQRMTNSN